MFKLKLNDYICNKISFIKSPLPAALADITYLTNGWRSLGELLEEGLSIDKLNAMIKQNFLSIGCESATFPASVRAYFEEQFPQHALARPLDQWLLNHPPSFTWLGLPYENALELHHSTSLGCSNIINSFPCEDNPFFGVFPFLQHSPQCHIDLFFAYAAIYNAESRVALLGGDHSITWSLLQQIHNFHKGHSIRYVHVDAHHDMYGIENKNNTRICHSNFLIDLLARGVVEEAILIGCRDNPEPINIAKSKGFSVQLLADEIKELDVKKTHTHLSIDIDVLDPSIAPSVSNPIENGWTKQTLFDRLSVLFAKFRPDSVSVVEACNTCPITTQTSIEVIHFINSQL